MLTSRSEYRLLLRADNADARLTPLGRDIGLVDDERWAQFEGKRKRMQAERARLGAVRIPESAGAAVEAERVGGQAVGRAVTLEELLRRPHVHYRCECEVKRALVLGCSGCTRTVPPCGAWCAYGRCMLLLVYLRLYVTHWALAAVLVIRVHCRRRAYAAAGLGSCAKSYIFPF